MRRKFAVITQLELQSVPTVISCKYQSDNVFRSFFLLHCIVVESLVFHWILHDVFIRSLLHQAIMSASHQKSNFFNLGKTLEFSRCQMHLMRVLMSCLKPWYEYIFFHKSWEVSTVFIGSELFLHKVYLKHDMTIRVESVAIIHTVMQSVGVFLLTWMIFLLQKTILCYPLFLCCYVFIVLV